MAALPAHSDAVYTNSVYTTSLRRLSYVNADGTYTLA
jgi:hypothetical protein